MKWNVDENNPLLDAAAWQPQGRDRCDALPESQP